MGLKHDTDFIPYSLRDTCASRLYAKTRDIMLVRKWLGHKNLQVTMRYTDLDPFELDQARDLMEAA
jgi:integrase